MQTAPLYADVAFGPDGGAAHWRTTADGPRIRIGHWTASGAKATVLIFPGRTEYIEKYGDAARVFQDNGYATVVVDWRGQGLSDRLTADRNIGHIGSFTDYQHDVAAILAYVKDLGLPDPAYMIGHSMGGCIGLRALMEGMQLKAAAFTAPMWGLKLLPVVRTSARVLSSMAAIFGKDTAYAPGQTPTSYVLRERFDINTLTQDREMWDRLVLQLTTYPDLALGGPSLRWLGESLRETLYLQSKRSPKIPTVTFLGTAEDIVATDPITSRMAQWPKGTLHMVPKAEHEVMIEIPPTRQFVYNTMLAHFAAHP